MDFLLCLLNDDTSRLEYQLAFAFLGGKELLNHVPTILAEFSPNYMRRVGLDPIKLISLLRSYNYRPYIIKGMNLEPIHDEFLLSVDLNYDLIWKKA